MNMINSRQKLAEQLLSNEVEQETPKEDKKPEGKVPPPKLKRPNIPTNIEAIDNKGLNTKNSEVPQKKNIGNFEDLLDNYEKHELPEANINIDNKTVSLPEATETPASAFFENKERLEKIEAKPQQSFEENRKADIKTEIIELDADENIHKTNFINKFTSDDNTHLTSELNKDLSNNYLEIPRNINNKNSNLQSIHLEDNPHQGKEKSQTNIFAQNQKNEIIENVNNKDILITAKGKNTLFDNEHEHEHEYEYEHEQLQENDNMNPENFTHDDQGDNSNHALDDNTAHINTLEPIELQDNYSNSHAVAFIEKSKFDEAENNNANTFSEKSQNINSNSNNNNLNNLNTKNFFDNLPSNVMQKNDYIKNNNNLTNLNNNVLKSNYNNNNDDNLSIPEVNCKSIELTNDNYNQEKKHSGNSLNINNQSNGNYPERENTNNANIHNYEANNFFSNLKENEINLNSKFDNLTENSHEDKSDGNKIALFEKEINSLRKIIDEYKKKELLENESMLHLEIINLKNIIKGKDRENQLLQTENNNLKSHIKILQDNIEVFFNENLNNNNIHKLANKAAQANTEKEIHSKSEEHEARKNVDIKEPQASEHHNAKADLSINKGILFL